MKEVGLTIRQKIPYKLTNSPEFTALIFQKTNETPKIYPRRTGIPDKRPL